jgi:hypothetical protein
VINLKKVKVRKNPKKGMGRGDFFSAKYDEWGGYWTVVFNPIGVHSGRYSEREAREGAQKSNALFSTQKARSNRFVGKTMKGYSASGKVIWEKKILSVSTSHPEMKAGTRVALLSDGKQVFGRDEDFQRWTKKKPRVKKNPNRPTKEFWNKVFPQVYGYYKKKGLAFAKKRGYKTVKELASATTASIWYEKISPTKKAVYERLRRKREVKSNPLVEYYKIKSNPIKDKDVYKIHSKLYKIAEELHFLAIVFEEYEDLKEDIKKTTVPTLHKRMKEIRDDVYGVANMVEKSTKKNPLTDYYKMKRR